MLVLNYNSTAHHTFNSLQRHQVQYHHLQHHLCNIVRKGTCCRQEWTPETSTNRLFGPPSYSQSRTGKLRGLQAEGAQVQSRIYKGSTSIQQCCNNDKTKRRLPAKVRGMGDSKCGIPFTVTAMRELSCLHSVRRVPKVLQFKLYSWKRVKYM